MRMAAYFTVCEVMFNQFLKAVSPAYFSPKKNLCFGPNMATERVQELLTVL